DEGARVLCGGALARPGFFVAPTVCANVAPDNVLWREEIFGPVALVRAFDTEYEAIALANDSDYGLVATVVTADAERAARVADACESGVVWVNAPQVIFPQTGWGGRKLSGIGRELGPWGVRAYQEIKHVIRARPAGASPSSPSLQP
ncbi:aldehyde dehydrogenase family protein, partial [Paraburkholderia sp. Ac-20347]|uniref:aldehyde dehydrogenase family protein n=1 Tax=Paraburkholderia sp. Ac-20347 TaxID=2703892 RepID=UPI00197D1607